MDLIEILAILAIIGAIVGALVLPWTNKQLEEVALAGQAVRELAQRAWRWLC
jgi:hypothetical protein